MHPIIPALYVALAQIPPTPTPSPPGEALFTMPGEYTLWGAAPEAVSFFNRIPADGQATVRLFFILGFLLLDVIVVYRFFRGMSKQDAEE